MKWPGLKAAACLTYKRHTALLQRRPTTMSTPIQALDAASTSALQATDAATGPTEVPRERQKVLALALFQDLAALPPEDAAPSTPGPRALPHQHG
jgi:hypothetical protein